MSAVALKFLLSAGIIVLSTQAGYGCRKLKWLPESASEPIMTFVAVFGYSSVAFLAVWGAQLHQGDVLLPVWAALHAVVMTFLGLAVAGWFAADRAERGLFAILAGLGNNGFTGGAFVLYLLDGEQALGLANIYILLFILVTVLLVYPVARHFAADCAGEPLGRLILRSLVDWRSIGLPLILAAILLSVRGVPRPRWVAEWHLVDILVYTITPLAFFGIGLRLRFSKVLPLLRMIWGLAAMRFLVGALVAIGLAWLTRWLPWPITGLRWKVYVIEGFVPTAITAVAVANMFRLRPEAASALFVVNTAMYLALVLPIVFWLFG